jgi:hypothetical protein
VRHPTIFAPERVICKIEDKSCDPYKNYLTRKDFLKSLDPNATIRMIFVSEIVGEAYARWSGGSKC